MQRPALNLLVDTIAACGMLGMLATGYILRFPLPPGSNKGLVLWGLSRHQWGDVHFWASVVLLTTIIVHVILHWQWIVSMVQKRVLGKQATPGEHVRGGLIAASVIVTLVALFVVATNISVSKRPEACCDEVTARPSGNPGQAVAGPEFWRKVYPMLQRRCETCHGPDEASADFRIDRWNDYFGPKQRVIPGHANKSSLVDLLRGDRPGTPLPRAHRLEGADLRLLIRWIDTGARWTKKKAGDNGDG